MGGKWHPYHPRFCIVCGERLVNKKRKYCSKCWRQHYNSYHRQWSKVKDDRIRAEGRCPNCGQRLESRMS